MAMPRNKVRAIRSLFATIEVVMRGIPAKHYVAKSCNASKYLLVMPRCSTSFRSQCDHLAVWVGAPPLEIQSMPSALRLHFMSGCRIKAPIKENTPSGSLMCPMGWNKI